MENDNIDISIIIDKTISSILSQIGCVLIALKLASVSSLSWLWTLMPMFIIILFDIIMFLAIMDNRKNEK